MGVHTGINERIRKYGLDPQHSISTSRIDAEAAQTMVDSMSPEACARLAALIESAMNASTSPGYTKIAVGDAARKKLLPMLKKRASELLDTAIKDAEKKVAQAQADLDALKAEAGR